MFFAKIFALVISFALAIIPWGVKRIDKKLAEGDYPTAEKREDSEPHLAKLIADAKGNDEYVKVMKAIATKQKIWWETRQDAIYYLGSYIKQPSVAKTLATIVRDEKEEYALRESAYRVLSPVTMPKKAKIVMLSRLTKAADEKGKIHLRIAKDLVELGAKKTAKKILVELLERSELDPTTKTDAEEFLKFVN